LVWVVSVVVVVVGPGTVVCCVVVEVLRVVSVDEQADKATRAKRVKDERINFFIGRIVGWF